MSKNQKTCTGSFTVIYSNDSELTNSQAFCPECNKAFDVDSLGDVLDDDGSFSDEVDHARDEKGRFVPRILGSIPKHRRAIEPWE